MIVSKKKMKTTPISCAADIADVLHTMLSKEDEIDRTKEHFWVIGLNISNTILYIDLCHLGGRNKCGVDISCLFRTAIMKGVSSLIVAHNHPGGTLIASENDKQLTQKIIDAGKLLGISVLDHVIITESDHVSLRRDTVSFQF